MLLCEKQIYNDSSPVHSHPVRVDIWYNPPSLTWIVLMMLLPSVPASSHEVKMGKTRANLLGAN